MKQYDKYKPSGIEWIGDIPENWEVKRLKYELDNFDHKRIPLNADQQGNGEYCSVF